jgi:hypothetical protein
MGYPEKNRHPAAKAPSTQASLPVNWCVPASETLELVSLVNEFFDWPISNQAIVYQFDQA